MVQAFGFSGTSASAAKIASRCRFKDAEAPVVADRRDKLERWRIACGFLCDRGMAVGVRFHEDLSPARRARNFPISSLHWITASFGHLSDQKEPAAGFARRRRPRISTSSPFRAVLSRR